MATSKASQPVKAGEVPANVKPVISFQDSMNAAASQIDALLRGGVGCVTYIASALLVGYLATPGHKIKLSVMRDEFSLALGKKGLGGTQTKKYLDMGQKIAAGMFKECSYGMEMGKLLAAETPDKAHDAVTGWLTRHTKGKKTEHGTKLDEATVKLNALGVFLGMEPDPGKPEKLDTDTDAQKRDKARVNAGKAIEKDPAILGKVPADKLVSTLGQVMPFSVLVTKHVETMTVARDIEAEFKAIEKAYKSRLAALKTSMGKPVKAPKAKATAKGEAPATASEAAAA